MPTDKIEELLNIDKAFSALCEEKGMNNAFIHFVAEDSVMLRPNSLPVIGKTKIENLFKGDGNNLHFTWEPLYADVAKSGDLGYTYGIYEIFSGQTIHKGTYVSVWKKDDNGDWKFVLDSGNEGLGNP